MSRDEIQQKCPEGIYTKQGLEACERFELN